MKEGKFSLSWFIKVAITSGVLFCMGIISGWYLGTGTLPPIGQKTIVILPPEIASKDLGEVTAAVEVDKTNEQVYREGFNCVDYAWNVMRALQWKGINTAIVGVTYEDGSRHALIAVPTSDKGWVCFEPETDARVKPVVGGYYHGKKVTKVEVLTMKWVNIKQFEDHPVFGITTEEAINE